MRRLAKNTRNDKYNSNRDYQTLHEQETQRIIFNRNGKNRLAFSYTTCENTDLVGFGGFIYPSCSGNLTLKIYQENLPIIESTILLSENWNRLGLSWLNGNIKREVLISLEFEKVKSIDFWGINCSPIDIREIVQFDGSNESLKDFINQDHLAPETFYIDHKSPNNLIINEDISDQLQYLSQSQRSITVKKCCYCQRTLPTNILKNNSSFHKHKSKISGFQNECRACKKWRINDSFNPERTKDQLHESSVITRERKILLREPEILKEIKDRHSGEGLKSIIWKRFSKRCFNCEKKLTLSEVRLDHTRPLAYLWPLDEHATCLCEKCNNSKHDEFPVDFYKSEEKLRKLAEITKLPYDKLTIKDVNETELKRIISDIDTFASEVDPRTFRSIANKVNEMRSSINLFEILEKRNKNVYLNLIENLEARPS